MINTANFLRAYISNTDYIIDLFYTDLISKEDQQLLQIAFAERINQSELNQFLKNWDIEKFGGKKSLLLSYVMKTNPNLCFPDYEKPRLEGLLKFYRFHNLTLISHYHKIVKALNTENIFPLIFKGGAMKHLRPDLSRLMGDIDILISNEFELTKARKICEKLGYIEEIPDDHSIDLHLPNSKEGTVDMHRYIALETNYDKTFIQDLFARSQKEQVFKTQAFVPCFEDMLFLGMINLAKNLNNQTSLEGVLYSLFDFNYLIKSKPNFNWDLVLENIIKTKTHAPALLAIKFVNKIIPRTIPENLLEGKKVNKDFTKYCNRIIFHQFYYDNFRQNHKKLSLKNAVKNFENMKEFISKKPKYFFVKRIIRKSNFLIRIFLLINYQHLKKI